MNEVVAGWGKMLRRGQALWDGLNVFMIWDIGHTASGVRTWYLLYRLKIERDGYEVKSRISEDRLKYL